MVTFSLTQYMVVLILLISAFLLIISFKVIRNAKRKSSRQIRRSNGLFLFSLTGIVICGIVILGENKPQNKEKVNIGDFIVEVHKTPEKINREAIDDKAKSNYYIQEKLQFILLRPSTGSFLSPIKTSYLEHFIKEMLFETRDNNLSAFLRFRSNKAMLNCVFKSYELNKTEDIASCAINMNKSGLFNHLLQFSYSIQFNSKQKTIIELTDKSSLPFENLFHTDSTTTIQNDSLKKGFPDIKSFNFQPYLNVIVFDKKNSKGEDQKINAANFLLMGANSFFQNIEKIVSNENHILLCGNLSFKNVKVNGEINNLVINRWFRIIDTEQKLYVLEMAHSPQQDKENKAWPELKKAFESFKLISN